MDELAQLHFHDEDYLDEIYRELQESECCLDITKILEEANLTTQEDSCMEFVQCGFEIEDGSSPILGSATLDTNIACLSEQRELQAYETIGQDMIPSSPHHAQQGDIVPSSSLEHQTMVPSPPSHAHHAAMVPRSSYAQDAQKDDIIVPSSSFEHQAMVPSSPSHTYHAHEVMVPSSSPSSSYIYEAMVPSLQQPCSSYDNEAMVIPPSSTSVHQTIVPPSSSNAHHQNAMVPSSSSSPSHAHQAVIVPSSPSHAHQATTVPSSPSHAHHHQATMVPPPSSYTQDVVVLSSSSSPLHTHRSMNPSSSSLARPWSENESYYTYQSIFHHGVDHRKVADELKRTPKDVANEYYRLHFLYLPPPIAPSRIGGARNSHLINHPCNNTYNYTSTYYTSNNNNNMKIKRRDQWTESDHRKFLYGMECYCKNRNDWISISENIFHGTKTPQQICSHAQKYFLRQRAKKSSQQPKVLP